MNTVKCPVEGCNFESKPKGLAAHLRHKHPEQQTDDEDCIPLLVRETIKLIIWLKDNVI